MYEGYNPISEQQKDLLARLVKQERITPEQLRDAEFMRDGETLVGVQQMSKTELSDWLEEHVFFNVPGEREKNAIAELFSPEGQVIGISDEGARHATA